MTSGIRPRVFLVEDHALIRDRVSALLSPACEIIGTAENGAPLWKPCGP
jgi:DNA-binding NarL/FixJ family response regulator